MLQNSFQTPFLLFRGPESSPGQEPLMLELGQCLASPKILIFNFLKGRLLIWLEPFPGREKKRGACGRERQAHGSKSQNIGEIDVMPELGGVIYHSPCPAEHDLAAGDTMSPSPSQMSLHYLAPLRALLCLPSVPWTSLLHTARLQTLLHPFASPWLLLCFTPLIIPTSGFEESITLANITDITLQRASLVSLVSLLLTSLPIWTPQRVSLLPSGSVEEHPFPSGPSEYWSHSLPQRLHHPLSTGSRPILQRCPHGRCDHGQRKTTGGS